MSAGAPKPFIWRTVSLPSETECFMPASNKSGAGSGLAPTDLPPGRRQESSTLDIPPLPAPHKGAAPPYFLRVTVDVENRSSVRSWLNVTDSEKIWKIFSPLRSRVICCGHWMPPLSR